MKHLFIVNPTAGGKDCTVDVRAKVEKAFMNREGSFEIYVTKAPMDAVSKIKSEAESGELLRVYACGGDGTFNECVCGAAMLPNVAVCPFPTGTGNDFCRMFGDEKDLFRDLDALLDGAETPIDLIECNGRYCANICSVGIDARIGVDVHKYSKIPLIGGATAYVVSTAVNIFKGLTRKMKVHCDDFTAEGEHTLVCACNGRFYGGGFNPSLDARPDDGLLDILVIKPVTLLQFPFLIGKYAAGKAYDLTKFVTHLRSDNLEMEFDEDEVIQLDGEAMYARKLSIRLVSKALRLIVPAGMRFFEQAENSLAAAK